MVEAPMCKLCKVKHWGVAHQFKEGKPMEQPDGEATYPGMPAPPPDPKPKKTPGSKEPAPLATPEVANTTRTSESLATRRGDRDKYNERQREYMKKRRAQAKAKP